jgi:hypothetical protein
MKIPFPLMQVDDVINMAATRFFHPIAYATELPVVRDSLYWRRRHRCNGNGGAITKWSVLLLRGDRGFVELPSTERRNTIEVKVNGSVEPFELRN